MKDQSARKYVYIGIFVFIAVAFIFKLMQLQVINTDYNRRFADTYAIKRIVRFPARGNILDRNGKILVGNDFAYDIFMQPTEAKPIDTADFCELSDITIEEFAKVSRLAWKRIKNKEASKTEPVPIVRDISKENVAAIQEKMFLFPGYYLEKKSLRRYPRPIGALVLGEVAECDTSITNHDSYYRPGDYIGKSGIEKSYEKVLRGTKGVRKVFVDVKQNERGKYLDGAEDTVSVQGENLTITIDADLQEYAELLMKNKKGAIVAIEPSTGEVLTMVSAPTYDPNLLVGRGRRKNYPILLLDPNKPLYNRAIMDGYPPGSTFKIFQALAGQQEGFIHNDTRYPCGSGFRISASHTIDCHGHGSPDLTTSIRASCNSYYCRLFVNFVGRYPTPAEGYAVWKGYANRFGFGQNFPGSDIPNIKKGNVPSPEYFNKIYPGRWTGMTLVSLGIGQGELQANALQICNLACVVANRGYWITPHVGKKVGDKSVDPSQFKKNYVGVDDKYFDVVQEGMYGVVNVPGGTATHIKLDDIVICGKTGTAQNPHGENHSVFMCYAPRENPKIAVGILIENAGFGGTWAAPIAALIVEKYLKGKTSKPAMEKQMMEKDLMNVVKTSRSHN
jgi:penicillin-binding protein 2